MIFGGQNRIHECPGQFFIAHQQPLGTALVEECSYDFRFQQIAVDQSLMLEIGDGSDPSALELDHSRFFLKNALSFEEGCRTRMNLQAILTDPVSTEAGVVVAFRVECLAQHARDLFGRCTFADGNFARGGKD